MARKIKLDFFSDFYDFPALETKLQDMAAQGLWLSAVLPLGIALFEQRAPGAARYALEPVLQGEGTAPAKEHVSFCRSQGWTYLDTVSSLFRVYVCTDPDAPNFYSDSDTRNRAMRPVRRLAAAGFVSSLLLLVLYGLLVVLLCIKGRFWLVLAEEPLPTLCAPFIVVWWFLSSLLRLRATRRRRRELSLGLPHKAPLIPRRRGDRLATLLLAFVLLLFLASQLYYAPRESLTPLTAGSQAPLSLSALEGAELALEEHYQFMDRDEGSYIKTHASPLAAVTQWEQHGRLPGGDGVTLSITRYRLTIPALAPGVMDGLINRWYHAPAWREKGLLLPQDVPGTQYFYAVHEQGVQHLFFAAGSCAAEIFYNGAQGLSPLYPQLVDQLT